MTNSFGFDLSELHHSNSLRVAVLFAVVAFGIGVLIKKKLEDKQKIDNLTERVDMLEKEMKIVGDDKDSLDKKISLLSIKLEEGKLLKKNY